MLLIRSCFFAEHDFDSEYLKKALRVVSPGTLMSANKVVRDVSVKIGSYSFLASPIVLGNSDIDLILGMDWLAMNKA